MTADEWLADLEAKAKAATPGAWHIIEADDERFMSAVYVVTTPEDATPGEKPENVIAVTLLQSPPVACIADEKWDENTAFIAAANPATVLRLVAMVRFLAFSAARSRGLFDDPAYWIDTAYAATEAQIKKEAQ